MRGGLMKRSSSLRHRYPDRRREMRTPPTVQQSLQVGQLPV